VDHQTPTRNPLRRRASSRRASTHRNPHARRGLSAPAALGALVLLTAGCADSGSDSVQVAAEQTTATTSTALTVVVTDPDITTWTLTCDPSGGDHPDAEAACAALTDDGGSALAPTPDDRMCTQLYGGAQTATVTGTWQGDPVEADFSRTDGCEIARWDALVPLLPKVTGAGAQ